MCFSIGTNIRELAVYRPQAERSAQSVTDSTYITILICDKNGIQCDAECEMLICLLHSPRIGLLVPLYYLRSLRSRLVADTVFKLLHQVEMCSASLGSSKPRFNTMVVWSFEGFR